jgi:hypothetical protein
MIMGIEQHHIEHYRTHGYAIVKNFLNPEELKTIRNELREIMPGWVEFCDNPKNGKPEGWKQDLYQANNSDTKFPFPGKALNAVTLHPEFRKFAKMMAGQNDVRCDESSLSLKCKGHPRDEDQVMHCDFGNHSLAYPPDDPTYWQTLFVLFYTDVDLDHAPTAICSNKHYRDDIILSRTCSRADRPELYANEKKMALSSGSILMYSLRTYHRGTRFLKDVGRIGHWVSYSPTAWPWLGTDGLSKYAGNLRATPDRFHNWIEPATPEERTAMGFPAPDHPYWTKETIAGVSARYPGMDMTPYERKMSILK